MVQNSSDIRPKAFQWKVVHVHELLVESKGAMKIGPFGSQLKKEFFVPNGIKVYGQENIFEKDMNFGERFITYEHYQRLKSCELFPGDFIISMMGTIGKSMLVPDSIQKGIMDSHLLRLQLDKSKIAPNFLAHLFTATETYNQIRMLAVGGIMQGLSSKIVNKIKFVCPSIGEQRKIASILSTIDAQIEKTEAIITKYEAIKQGMLYDLFTRGIDVATGKLRPTHEEVPELYDDSPLGYVPKKWTVANLGEITDKVGSGITPTGGSEVYQTQGVVFIRSQNVLENELSLADVAYISPQIDDKMSASRVQQFDVLLNITGASIGRCAFYPFSSMKANVNQHVCIIRFKEQKNVLASFASVFLNSNFGQNQINRLNAGGNREGLNFAQIRSFNFPVIQPKELASINEKINTQIALIKHETLYLSKLQLLKQGLMSDLLSGKVPVTLNKNEAV